MDKKLLMFGLVLFGIIGMSGMASAGFNINIWTANNTWFEDTTPAISFNVTSNDTFACNLTIDQTVLSGVGNATTQGNNASILIPLTALTAGNHTFVVNCTNVSAGAAGPTNASANRTLYIHSSALVSSWYTTNGTDTELAYPATHAVLANNTVNFYVTMNTSGGWNATIKGYNRSESWVNMTILYGYTDGTGTDAKIRVSSENFDDNPINLSTASNDTIKIFISNKTSSQVQVLEVGVWTNMLVVSSNVDTMAVGAETTVYYNITDWKGTAIAGYMNYTPTAILNETYAGGGYDIQVYEAQASNNRPMTAKYVQNLSLFAVDSSGGVTWDTGNLSVNKTISITQGSISADSIVTTSAPLNVYKYFQTNITVNVTLMNETIVGNDDYATKDVNVTITTEPMNYTINATNTTNGYGTFANVTFTNNTVNNFRNVTASGDVSLDVTVLIDVNRDGLWDYNTSVTGEKTIQDAADIVILAVNPSSQNISAEQAETVVFTVKNQSNMNIPFNITISSSDTKFYNGTVVGTTQALTTYTEANDSGGGSTLVITAEQNGTIDVTVSATGLTSVTDTLGVYGGLLNRTGVTVDDVADALGTKFTYNQTYTLEFPVKKRNGEPDYSATVNITRGGSLVSSNASKIHPTEPLRNGYAIHQFKIAPVVTGYLNVSIYGSDGNNITVKNGFDVAYIRNYTLEATYAASTVTSLSEGLNNTINITVKEGSDINGGNLTVTYYNSTQSGGAYLGRDVIPGVSNMSSVGLVVPKTATRLTLEISNASESKSGNISMSVVTPAATLSNQKIINTTDNTVLVSRDSPSNIVLINGTTTNLTFSITNTDYVAGMTIYVYEDNKSTGGRNITWNTTADTVILTQTNISTLLTWAGLNATNLYVQINNSAAVGWNIMNVSFAQPTVTPSVSSVPVDANTSVTITVTAGAAGQELAGINVTVQNTSNTTMGSNLTDSNGQVTMLLGPTNADTLKIRVNGIVNSQTITATKTLAVTYTPSVPNIGEALVLSVRPSGSTTELVTSSYIEVREPGSGVYVLQSATDGTYTVSSPTLGTYAAYAVKSGWTDSSVVYITVAATGTTTTTSTTSTTTTTTSTSTTSTSSTTTTAPAAQTMTVSVSPTSVPVGTATDLTVTVTNMSSSENVSGATVTASGAGVNSTSATGTTDANGSVTISVTATSAGTITITVTKTGFTDATSSVSATTTSTTTTSTTSTSTTSTSTTSTSTTSTSTTSTTSTTTTTVSTCELPGDTPPCGTVELAEVIDHISLWSAGSVDLSEVIDLINAWSG